jgi:hypothetical protein
MRSVTREAYVGLRLTAAEQEKLELLAEAQNETVSAALRKLLNTIVIVLPPSQPARTDRERQNR